MVSKNPFAAQALLTLDDWPYALHLLGAMKTKPTPIMLEAVLRVCEEPQGMGWKDGGGSAGGDLDGGVEVYFVGWRKWWVFCGGF